MKNTTETEKSKEITKMIRKFTKKAKEERVEGQYIMMEENINKNSDI